MKQWRKRYGQRFPLEEHAEFSARPASRSNAKKRTRLATRFREKADASREDATVLRELLEKTGESVVKIAEELEIPDERTGTD